jgi:hypothetical protein
MELAMEIIKSFAVTVAVITIVSGAWVIYFMLKND